MANAASSDIWEKPVEERKRTRIKQRVKQTEQMTLGKIEIMQKTKENFKKIILFSVLRERKDITSIIQE